MYVNYTPHRAARLTYAVLRTNGAKMQPNRGTPARNKTIHAYAYAHLPIKLVAIRPVAVPAVVVPPVVAPVLVLVLVPVRLLAAHRQRRCCACRVVWCERRFFLKNLKQ